SPELSAGGDFFSLTLKRTTLNYYEQTSEPVMIVLCDLSRNPDDPAQSPLYFVWAKDELKRVAGTDDNPDSETRTIRIPTANVLNRDLDITAYLEHSLRLSATASAFDQAVTKAVPDVGPNAAAQILQSLSDEIPRRGRGYFESLSTPAPTPWP